MSREFTYDPHKMRDISNNLVEINECILNMNSDIQNAKEVISNMESLGFLNTKEEYLQIIQTNLIKNIVSTLEDYQEMISQNCNDVVGTDKMLASQIKEKRK